MGWAISVGDDLYQLGEGAGMGSEIALLTDFSMGIHVLCVCVFLIWNTATSSLDSGLLINLFGSTYYY